MTSWDPPWVTVGRATHVRVSATVVGTDIGRACLEQVALKTHPQVMVQPWVERRYHRYHTFPLGLVRDAVAAIEHGDVDAGPQLNYAQLAHCAVEWLTTNGDVFGEVHPAAARWVEDTLANYLETAEARAAELGLQPGPRDGWRIVHDNGTDTSEMTVWGTYYNSAGGQLRETWLLRLREMSNAAAPKPATVAAAAYVTAFGIRTLRGDKFSQPHTPASPADPAPAHVRVREVSVTDGSDRVVFDGTPEQARELWRPHQALARAFTSGGSMRAGIDCESCGARHACPELPTNPGLLGLPGYGHQPRQLAPTALTTYAICPAKYLLTKVVRLPRAERYTSVAMRRGLSTHAWLEAAHRRSTRCSTADLPAPDAPRDEHGEPVDAGLSAEDYADIRPYLVQHLAVCPVSSDTNGLWPEADVVLYDVDADVTVSSRADLLLARAGRAGWRETKTVVHLPDASDQDLLVSFPQVALAVCVLADGILGHRELARVVTGQPEHDDGSVAAAMAAGAPVAQLPPGFVELELLTPEASRLVTYDAADERTVMLARRALAQAAHDWHNDDEFAATPGAHCAVCDVATWCPSAFGQAGGGNITVDGVIIDPSTGEVVTAATGGAPTARQTATILSLITNPPDPTDEDEDPPF